MIYWHTRHDWKTKPGLRFDGQIVLLTEPHREFCYVINVNEDMEDIPKCWQWAKLHQVVEYAAVKTLDISGYHNV